MKKTVYLVLSLSVLGISLGVAPAEALTITYSEKTQRPAPLLDFRAGYDLPFNLNINGKVAFAPDLSSFVAPPLANSGATGNALTDLINQQVKWDALLDTNLNLGYRFELFDLDVAIGHVQSSLMPYAGYRQYWTFTGTLSQQTNSSARGLHYGARWNLGLPLGFSGYAYAEATTLMGGSFEQGGNSEELQTNGLTLPGYGVGVNWTLPILNAASVYAGYQGFFLPGDLRMSNSYNGSTELIHGISVGASLLWFGI